MRVKFFRKEVIKDVLGSLSATGFEFDGRITLETK